MDDKLDSKKTDYLILLVGTNPLPNYVAAKLLLNEGGQLYLLHSENTREEAKRIKETLDVNTVFGEIREADADNIEQKIESWVKPTPQDESIGLNYTGGTKMMAVHAHRAFLAAMKNYHPNQTPICSYLDARSYEMKFDAGGSEPVLKSVDVPLEKLLALHKIELKGTPNRKVVLENSANSLAHLFADIELGKKWRHWCEAELKPKTWHLLDSKKKYERQLAEVTLNFPLSDDLQGITRSIFADLNVDNRSAINLSDTNVLEKFRKPKYFCKWLDGIWLENYVLAQIIELSKNKDLHLTDWGMSLDTNNTTKFNFEFDIAVMKGYQFFGLSCSTTINHKLAKSKLFEAYTRAHQLGGGEARVGLVVPHDKPYELQRELEQNWNVEGKVRVFGREHLENLRDELQEWFESA